MKPKHGGVGDRSGSRKTCEKETVRASDKGGGSIGLLRRAGNTNTDAL